MLADIQVPLSHSTQVVPNVGEKVVKPVCMCVCDSDIYTVSDNHKVRGMISGWARCDSDKYTVSDNHKVRWMISGWAIRSALSTISKWELTEKEKPAWVSEAPKYEVHKTQTARTFSWSFLLVQWKDKSPPCNAGDSGSVPGQGTKISHAVELLSLHTTRESVQHNERFHGCKEDPTHCN